MRKLLVGVLILSLFLIACQQAPVGERIQYGFCKLDDETCSGGTGSPFVMKGPSCPDEYHCEADGIADHCEECKNHPNCPVDPDC